MWMGAFSGWLSVWDWKHEKGGIMTTITLICRGGLARARVEGSLTQGMVGIPVTLDCDEAWAGLSKQLKVRCGGVVRTAAAEGETVCLPYECLIAGQRLDCGLDGWDSGGTLRIPTNWACCGPVLYSVAEVDGEPGALPAPPEDTVSQLLERMEQTEQSVQTLSQQVEQLPQSVPQVTEQTVAGWGFTKNTGSYSKPAAGIPEADLSAQVQEKLNAAGTAELPDNVVLYEEDPTADESDLTMQELLDKLTLEADDTYIYLKYGETVLGMVEAGSGGGTGTVYCTAIAIDQSELSIALADTGDHGLSATVQPVDCTQIVKWYTSNSAVVTVDSTGKLTPVGAGTATITAKCGTQSDTLTVTVVDNSVTVYFGYSASWSYSTPSSPVLGGNSARGYSSALSSDSARKASGSATDSAHDRAIKIEPGCTYRLRYSGTDTNWYEGWCILSDTEKLNDNGWQNIGSLKEVTINNHYDDGLYLYFSLKYGSGGSTAVTDTLISEFISNTTLERVM